MAWNTKSFDSHPVLVQGDQDNPGHGFVSVPLTATKLYFISCDFCLFLSSSEIWHPSCLEDITCAAQSHDVKMSRCSWSVENGPRPCPGHVLAMASNFTVWALLEAIGRDELLLLAELQQSDDAVKADAVPDVTSGRDSPVEVLLTYLIHHDRPLLSNKDLEWLAM